MDALARLFLVLGALFLLLGGVLKLFGGRLGWFGKLPGDLRIGDSFYFPLASCIVLSVVLTLLVNVLLRIFRR